MKKILLLVMSMGVMVSAAYADDLSLNDKITSMLKDGQSIENIYAKFSDEYGHMNLLTAMTLLTSSDQQKDIIKIALHDAPTLVAVLRALPSVDSKVIRTTKPGHDSESHSEQANHSDQTDHNDQASNQFNPNDLAPTASGNEDGNNLNDLRATGAGDGADGIVEVASLDNPGDGESDTVSP